MSILRGSRIVAEIEPAGVSGSPGISRVRIRFSVKIRMHTWPESALINLKLIRSVVSVGIDRQDSTYFGFAYPERGSFEQNNLNSFEQRFLFDCVVSDDQIEAIEKLRNGGNLIFKLEVQGYSYDATGQADPAYDDVYFDVNQSSWCTVLEQLGAGMRLFIEIPLPNEKEYPKLHNAIREVADAHNHMLRGSYGDAVGSSRKALEAAETELGLSQSLNGSLKKFRGQLDERESMTEDERFALMHGALKHLTQMGHHGDRTGARYNLDRNDAGVVLGTTILVLSRLLARRV